MIVLLTMVFVFSCRKDEEEKKAVEETILPDTAVNFDLTQIPFYNLSDYHFFLGNMKMFSPNNRVLPYEPISQLFTDYAHKSRFIWMPAGVSATYVTDHKVFDFPNGTVMIKNFYYDHVQPNDERKILETRLIYKKDNAWHFADYIWNEDQTEATFNLQGLNVPISWIDDIGNPRTIDYRIPAESECFTCHKLDDTSLPIGPKPQNLNKDFTYVNGTMNQLQKWIEVGYLTNTLPTDIVTVVDWKDATQPLEQRVRSYIDINCAHCHQEGSHCSYRPLRFAYSETLLPENLGICVAPQEFISEQLTHIISRGNINRSVMFFRMNSVEQQYRMPLMGRTIVHDEAVALITEYIQSLSPACP